MIVGEHLVPIGRSAFEPLIQKGSVADLAHYCTADEDFEQLNKGTILILFAEEDGYGTYANNIIGALGFLFPAWQNLNVAFLGYLITSANHSYNLSSLETVLKKALKSELYPLLISSQKTFAELFCTVMADQYKLDLAIIAQALGSSSDKITSIGLRMNTNTLKNLSIIGHQAYFSEGNYSNKQSNRYYQEIRLGAIRESIRFAEPSLRDANLLLVDMSALRSSDFCSSKHPSPNGMYAEELCQLMRYAGFSDNSSGTYIGGFTSSKIERSEVDSMLLAQLIWHLLDGISNRRNEKPGITVFPSKEFYIDLGEQEPLTLKFLQSEATGRWWLYIPNGNISAWIACDAEDYERARHHELPFRWILYTGVRE